MKYDLNSLRRNADLHQLSFFQTNRITTFQKIPKSGYAMVSVYSAQRCDMYPRYIDQSGKTSNVYKTSNFEAFHN